MKTLLSDELGFCELFEGSVKQQNLELDFYNDYQKDFAEKLSAACAPEGAFLCDGALVDAAKRLNIAHKDVIVEFLQIEIKQNFNEFKIALHEEHQNEALEALLQRSGAKKVTFECARFESGARYLGFDDEAAYRQAARVLLDAYDSGADFLLVNDAASFRIFDGQKRALQMASNREFDDFYVLSSAEFIGLLMGKKISKLAAHKLKVRLL